MAQYYVKVVRVYEDYIEAESKAEAVAIVDEAMNDGDFCYTDCDVELCVDEDEEEED